jgi:DMSO/TMAO reductase YedYZ molybdopterin-dependent catalytic subunit
MSARLHVGGRVQEALDLDFAALCALSGQLVEPSALLAGREIAAVPLSALVALAGMQSTACSLVAESTDGSFTTALPIEAIEQSVVVYRIGSAPLPRDLGGPFRLVTNGRLRCGDVKSLGAIYVSERPFVVEEPDTEPMCVRAAR